MVCSHRCSAEEGTSAPLLSKTAEEVWNEPQHPQILLHLHCGDILTGCITAWFGNRKALQRVVRTARHIVGGELPSLQDIYTRRCIRKARRIIKDSSHPSHSLLSLLPSGKHLRSIRSHTSRLRDSFFPQAQFNTVQLDYTHTLHKHLSATSGYHATHIHDIAYPAYVKSVAPSHIVYIYMCT